MITSYLHSVSYLYFFIPIMLSMKFWIIFLFSCFFSLCSFGQFKSFNSLSNKWNLKLNDRQAEILNQRKDFTIEDVQEQFSFNLSREALSILRIAIILKDETSKKQKRKLYRLLKKYYRQEKKSQLYLFKQNIF